MGLTACSIDEVREDIAALENRVAALEEWQASVNSDLMSLSKLVNELESRNLITAVTPLLENGEEIGYRISFQTGDPIVIYHGEPSTYIPLIGVAQNDAGDFCWTLDGEFITDEDGDLVPVVSDLVPQVRINSNNNEWEISTDGGQTWDPTGVPATGEKGETGDALFADIDYTTDPENVTFTLADGTILVMPRCMELTVSFADGNGVFGISPDNNVIQLILTGIDAENYNALVAELKAEDGTSSIDITTKAGGDVVVTPPTFNQSGVYNGDAKVTINKAGSAGEQALLTVTLIDNEGNEVSASRIVEFYGNVLEAAAQLGGSLVLEEDLVLASTVVVPEGKTLELDLGGKKLSNTEDIWSAEEGNWSFLSVRGGTLIVKNGTIDAKENDCYAIDVQDGGKVIIESGTYIGNIHSVYVLQGSAEIKGGTFSVKQKYSDQQPDQFVINCFDANYKNGSATVSITGGTFHGFNPANCEAEGIGTDFVVEDYYSKKVNDSPVTYEVSKVEEITSSDVLQQEIAAGASEIVLGSEMSIDADFVMAGVQNVNLNGHKLTVKSIQSINNNADVTISNGKIKITSTTTGVVLGGAKSNMTLDGVTIDATSLTSGQNALVSGSNDHTDWVGNTLTVRNSEINANASGVTGINMRGASKLVVDNSTITHKWFGITQNGVYPGSVFEITNTTISGFATGIYLSNNANGPVNTLTVKGGKIHSEAGSPIEVKKTNLVVRDVTLSSKAAPSYDFNAGGAGASGHAIVLAGYQQGTPYEGTITTQNVTYDIPDNALKVAKYNGTTVVEVVQ